MKKDITLLLGVPLASLAGDLPERDITDQITFSPGGGADIRAQHPMPEENSAKKCRFNKTWQFWIWLNIGKAGDVAPARFGCPMMFGSSRLVKLIRNLAGATASQQCKNRDR